MNCRKKSFEYIKLVLYSCWLADEFYPKFPNENEEAVCVSEMLPAVMEGAARWAPAFSADIEALLGMEVGAPFTFPETSEIWVGFVHCLHKSLQKLIVKTTEMNYGIS